MGVCVLCVSFVSVSMRVCMYICSCVGGAIYALNELHVEDSVFRGCRATYGGRGSAHIRRS